MKNYPFPDPPEAPDLPWFRRIPSLYYWWLGAFVFLAVTIVWLPSQCTLDDLGLPERGNSEESGYSKLDQDKDLEFRQDGLWYEIDSNASFSGFAESYHPNGKIRSRTKIKEGVAYGLIEEWDANGTKQGTPFKDEFLE